MEGIGDVGSLDERLPVLLGRPGVRVPGDGGGEGDDKETRLHGACPCGEVKR